MGDVDHNYKAVDRLMSAQNQSANLVVLPFNSFIGNGTITKENVTKYAEPLNGKSYNLASNLAKKFATNLVFSMPESSNGKFYETAVLFDPQGKQVGIYRKSHLNDVEATWATAGNELPAFILDIGSVSIILNDEVRIPDLTNIHMLNRANMLVVPTAYNQKEYGGDVNIPKGLVPEEANKGMYIWYSMAKYSQAYTLVANYIKGEHGDVGQSALYSLVPEEGYYPPKIAPRDQEGAFVMNFGTNGNLDLWTNQQDKIHERRWDLALPLTLDQNSACFKEWKKNSASRDVCKAQY
jgi:predicted amidohydrolase